MCESLATGANWRLFAKTCTSWVATLIIAGLLSAFFFAQVRGGGRRKGSEGAGEGGKEESGLRVATSIIAGLLSALFSLEGWQVAGGAKGEGGRTEGGERGREGGAESGLRVATLIIAGLLSA